MSMTTELRWALLIVGLVFIGVLIWWELRRPRQARGAPERLLREAPPETPPRALREPPLEPPTRVREVLPLPEMRAREPVGSAERLPEVEVEEPARLPMIEPANEVEQLAELEIPQTADAADEAEVPAGVAADIAFGEAVYEEPAATYREPLPELPAEAPPRVEWPPDAERRIVALRLVAQQPNRFAGRSLRQALAAEGFVLGQFAIFHKADEEHRAVLSAASLTRPGTFDMDTMDSQHYGGLSLFAVLPGPKSPPQAFDELVFTARSLNERLNGVLQDEAGTPLTPARVAHLREQLRDLS
jgi:cell division protein ZipA